MCLQHKHANDLKTAIGPIAKQFGGNIPDIKKELQKIYGVSQEISLLILEEVFKKVEVSLSRTFFSTFLSLFFICAGHSC